MNVTRRYSGIVLHLQQLVGNQIGSVSKDQQAKAKAYLKMLTSQDMVLVMNLMFDILSVCKKASMSFQERNARAVDIHTLLQSVCGVLKNMKWWPLSIKSELNRLVRNRWHTTCTAGQRKLPTNSSLCSIEVTRVNGKKIWWFTKWSYKCCPKS